MKNLEFKAYLRENDLKYTKTRQEIYNFLTNTHSHPTAEEVFKEVKKTLPGISYATIYNVLNLFVDRGLAKVVSTYEDKKHYDGNLTPHIHFVCLECGKIEDVDYEDKTLIEALKEKKWYIKDTSLNIFGICPECFNKKTKKKK